MSAHYHAVVTDPEGVVPACEQWLPSPLARATNLKVQATVGNQGYVAASKGAKVTLYATGSTAADENGADATFGPSADASSAAFGPASGPASGLASGEVELATWIVDQAIEPGELSSVHTFEVPLTVLVQALGQGDAAPSADAGSNLLGLHATVTPAAGDTEYRTANNDTAWGLAPCTLPPL